MKDNDTRAAEELFPSGHQPPSNYRRVPQYQRIVCDKDVAVTMRDGVTIMVDVYRPDAAGKFPVLFAFGVHSKEVQGSDYPKTFPPQPSWSSLWLGHAEAGDTEFFVARGYVHVIGTPRGFLKSGDGGSREWDSYDVIEWIAQQPWCDGNIGMVGIGAFASEQFHAARQQPPHLKTIFAYDPRGAYGKFGGFREEYPGGVLHAFRYLMDHFSSYHFARHAPGELPPEQRREMARGDGGPGHPHVSASAQCAAAKRPAHAALFRRADRPVRQGGNRRRGGAGVQQYHGADLHRRRLVRLHLQDPSRRRADLFRQDPGAEENAAHRPGASRPAAAGAARRDAALVRPLAQRHRHRHHAGAGGRYFVMGANEWRHGDDWPLPETQWTKLYLSSWERLTAEPYIGASVDAYVPPDVFVQMPPTQTNRIQKLRFLTDPLPHDLLIAGPSVLNLFAAIDQDDTNWIIVLKDVGPDPSVRTAREGEREIPTDLAERELTRGWLKASNRALDPQRSKPWKPWHKLTRDARQKVTPGEIEEYSIEIFSTANLFRRGHRICIEITSLDLSTGVLGATNVEYIPYHVCSSRTVVHSIYHDAAHPSHLLLPVVPTAG